MRAQRKIAPMLARPLGVPRPQWRALCLFEESERVAGVVAKEAAGAASNGAANGKPSTKGRKSAQVAPA